MKCEVVVDVDVWRVAVVKCEVGVVVVDVWRVTVVK